jgi:predicted amidophosphoribosyltransferase
VTVITCPSCHKTLESGPDYCPHCFLKLPAMVRPHEPPPPPRRAPAPSTHREHRGDRERGHAPRVSKKDEAKPAGQCPACSHPITTKDEWCKWCHWPVNRKP